MDLSWILTKINYSHLLMFSKYLDCWLPTTAAVFNLSYSSLLSSLSRKLKREAREIEWILLGYTQEDEQNVHACLLVKRQEII